VKTKQSPAMIYLIHINAIDEKNEKQNDDDKYKQLYTSLYPDVCGDIPPGLPPQRSYDHHIVLEKDSQQINQPAYRASTADLLLVLALLSSWPCTEYLPKYRCAYECNVEQPYSVAV